MADQITIDAAWDFLHAIERGEITLTTEARALYCGVAVYHASNGWKIAIFDDCDEFDYIEWIRDDDGNELEFGAMPPEMQGYYPPGDTIITAYHWDEVG